MSLLPFALSEERRLDTTGLPTSRAGRVVDDPQVYGARVFNDGVDAFAAGRREPSSGPRPLDRDMKVTLRRLLRADEAQVLSWRNSADVARWMYTDHLITMEEHARWLDSALTKDDRRYWIVELDGAAVGLANLARIDQQTGCCVWAFYLADPAVRGRGVGGVVEHAVVSHAFEDLGLRKLWCEVLAENTSVIRLHQRFGFVQEAVFREHVIKQGRPCDVIGLGLLRHEWTETRDRLTRQGIYPVPTP